MNQISVAEVQAILLDKEVAILRLHTAVTQLAAENEELKKKLAEYEAKPGKKGNN